ncbi:MAG: hypothetical protein ACREQ5_37565 [Candidatus Dormibacteria bacterium]
MKTVFFVGMNKLALKASQELQDAIEETKNLLLETAKGYSLSRVETAWINNAGRSCEEIVLKFEVHGLSDGEAKVIGAQLRDSFEQECVLVERFETGVQFI